MDIIHFIDELEKNHIDILCKDDLIRSLRKFSSMIGMNRIKTEFIKQIVLIIQLRREGKQMPVNKQHIVISGPPGVGKSTASICIAEILACLETFNCRKEKEGVALRSKDAFNMVNILSETMTLIEKRYGEDREDEAYNNICERLSQLVDICDSKINPVDFDIGCCPDLPYVISNRSDFVGTHVGHTSEKTKDFLENNVGKIIIVEEAYSLYEDDRDVFGKEALNIINQYMSEFPRDYIFIFNGYKDRLENSIFKAQEGLSRRIQYRFDIEPYTSGELYLIFFRMLEEAGEWRLDFKLDSSFFKEKMKYFNNYAGDIERLIFHIQIAYGQYCRLHNKMLDCLINKEIFELGFSFFVQEKKSSVKEDCPYHHCMYG